MSKYRLFGTFVCLFVTASAISWAQPPAKTTSKLVTSTETAEVEREAKDKEREEFYELLMTFADTIDQIDRNYVERVSRRELLEAAIDGALRKLDPYSDYIAPDEIAKFRVEVDNEFGGIGIQISSRNGQLAVISPLVGTPAYRSGIVAGDLILAIEGKPTKDMSIADAIKLMKGRPGSKVTLTVFHPLKSITEQIELTREVIKVQTVLADRRNPDDSWKFMYDDNDKIGYIRLTTFGKETARDLKAELAELETQGMQALVLDLRFNPGGLLRSAIEVSDLFLSEGKIVSTDGRNVEQQTWSASKGETFEEFPMVVLVNQFSASASEIVSAALQDHGRAVVIGQQTFGKASVQNVVELEGGKSALKITTGSYQRPSGKPIHRFPEATEWGVRPDQDFEVPLSDYELQQLINQRHQRDIVSSRAYAEPSTSFDPQLRRALNHIRVQLAKSKTPTPTEN